MGGTWSCVRISYLCHFGQDDLVRNFEDLPPTQRCVAACIIEGVRIGSASVQQHYKCHSIRVGGRVSLHGLCNRFCFFSPFSNTFSLSYSVVFSLIHFQSFFNCFFLSLICQKILFFLSFFFFFLFSPSFSFVVFSLFIH